MQGKQPVTLRDELAKAEAKANAIDEQFRDFYENFPLHRRINMPNGSSGAMPSIKMDCPRCTERHTFTFTRIGEVFGRLNTIEYKCAGCSEFTQIFIIERDESPVTYWKKVGQFPPWKISVDKQLAKSLGDSLQLYQHGMACEAIGYGIGAHVYYRRVVEAILHSLLDEIGELIDQQEDKEAYLAALARAKTTRQTEAKIELVRDFVPNDFKIGGHNPLGLLHSSLSEGVHNLSDEDCLKHAAAIRTVLSLLVKKLADTRHDRDELSHSMKSLLRKPQAPAPPALPEADGR